MSRLRFVGVRHGFSVPNEKDIICSHIENGVKPEFGLHAKGVAQVASDGVAGVRRLINELKPSHVLVISSPFSRANQTANIILDSLRVDSAVDLVSNSVVVDARLCERHFGALELQGAAAYHGVWAADAAGEDAASPDGVEPLASVWGRVRSLMSDCETSTGAAGDIGGLPSIPDGTLVFLVSHGDTLQISQCGVAGVPLSQHRSMPHLNQAECRCLF
jgi:broad specificity phosphatase PhoE